MSYHMKIMPSRPEAAARHKKTPVTVGLSLASSREIVWRPTGDKAIAQRAAYAAALSDGTSTLHNVPHSDDIEGNLGILRQLGVDIWEAADTSYVIGGRGCISRIRLADPSPPACAVSSPARLATCNDDLGSCVVTIIDDGERAAITWCGSGRAGNPALLDDLLARLPQ